MKKLLLLLTILLTIGINSAKANFQKWSPFKTLHSKADSTRLAELNRFWTTLSQTVQSGDFEGYKALYHKDAVVVFTTGKNKTSASIEKAMANWKQGFKDTKTGKQTDKVEFRFSQRIGSETTAHETGIFYFTSYDSNRKVKAKEFIHFEMLLIKGDNGWQALMEYQKFKATQEEWDTLK